MITWESRLASINCATEGDSVGGFHWRNKLTEQQESLFGNSNPIFHNSGHFKLLTMPRGNARPGKSTDIL